MPAMAARRTRRPRDRRRSLAKGRRHRQRADGRSSEAASTIASSARRAVARLDARDASAASRRERCSSIAATIRSLLVERRQRQSAVSRCVRARDADAVRRQLDAAARDDRSRRSAVTSRTRSPGSKSSIGAERRRTIELASDAVLPNDARAPLMIATTRCRRREQPHRRAQLASTTDAFLDDADSVPAMSTSRETSGRRSPYGRLRLRRAIATLDSVDEVAERRPRPARRQIAHADQHLVQLVEQRRRGRRRTPRRALPRPPRSANGV